MKEEDFQLQMAESQLRGFGHASQGFSIISLVESMGLTAAEWTKMRKDIKTIKESDKEDIDAFFKK